MSKSFPNERDEVFVNKKWTRRSQRSFLESLSVNRQPIITTQRSNTTPIIHSFTQDGIHPVTSRKGVICSFTVKDADLEEEKLIQNEKNKQKKKNKCISMRKNDISSKPLSKFIIRALNTQKFNNFTVSQIPGFMDVAGPDGGTLKKLRVSNIIEAKRCMWNFGKDMNLQKSTILSSFYLLDRVITLHKVNSENIKKFAWALLFVSAKLNEEEETFNSSVIFKAILDKSVINKKTLAEVEIMVLTALGCKILPSKEEFATYEQISFAVFN